MGTVLREAHSVDEEILKTLVSLKARALPPNGEVVLRDDANEPNLTMACELIECFLVPAVLGGLRDQVKSLLPWVDARKLMGAALSIADANKENDDWFLGGSYLIRDTEEMENDQSITDAASFSLTACLHFRELYSDDVRKDGWIEEKTGILIDEAIRFLNNACAKNKDNAPEGWCWGTEGRKYPYRYFTYVALDGMLDLVRSLEMDDKEFLVGRGMNNVKDVTPLIQKAVSSLLKYLDDPGLCKGALELPDDYTKDSTQSWYFNLWTIYSVLAIWPDVVASTISGRNVYEVRLKEAIDRIINEYITKPTRSEFDKVILNLALVKGNKASLVARWTDRSFCPLLLKTFSAYARHLGGRDASTDAMMTTILNQLFSRRADPKLNDWVWVQPEKGFSIYYTERAIEALVKYKGYLDVPLTVPKSVSMAQSIPDTVPMSIHVPLAELQAIVGRIKTIRNEDMLGALSKALAEATREVLRSDALKGKPSTAQSLMELDMLETSDMSTALRIGHTLNTLSLSCALIRKGQTEAQSKRNK